MKTGLIYAAVASLVSMVLMAFLAPLIFHDGDMEALGRVCGAAIFFVIAIPAFVIGYLKSTRRS